MTTRTHSPLRQAQDAAKARGAKTFHWAEPCINGHTGLRYAANGNCLQCISLHNRARYSKPDHERQLRLSYANSKLVQVRHDTATMSDATAAKDMVRSLTGRSPSLSLLHKAGLRLLTTYLSNAPAASSVMALFS